MGMSMPRRPGFFADRDGPGLTLLLVALVVVAVLGAKFFGFSPRRPAEDHSRPQVEDRESEPTAPLVIIYNAHPTENYAPSPPHAQGAGDIVSVGRSLDEALRGRSLRSRLVADIPPSPWSQSFAEAKRAVQPVLEAATGLEAILDIHRDAISDKPDGYTTTMVGGRPVAKILLVVGDVDNPYIEENLAFAESVRTELEKLAPGITRSVKVLHEAVNGDLHPQSLQVHIGDYTDNTLEEAMAAVPILAQALVKVLAPSSD